MDEYEKMMNNEEDSEENVFIEENEGVFEENLFIDKDLRKINEKPSTEFKEIDDFYDDIVEKEDEKEEIEEKEEILKENNQKEKPIIISESKNTEKINIKKNKKKGEGDKMDKEAPKKKPTRKVPNKKASKVTKTKKPAKKSQKKKNYFWPIFLSIVGIAIIIWAIFYLKGTLQPTTNEVVATVNGQEVSLETLTKEYEFFFLLGGLPDTYKEIITKENFLNSSLIAEVLILQEANKLGISVDMAESEAVFLSSIETSNIDLEDFKNTLNSVGLTFEEANKYFNYQLVSFKLLNQTVLGGIEVSDEEILLAYEENKELIEAQGQTFEDLKGDLKNLMLEQKQREAAQSYLAYLRDSANVEITYKGEAYQPISREIFQETTEEDVVQSQVSIETFTATEDELCVDENGKPLVILYSTTSCPHCVWIKNTFDEVVSEYEEISAYHWELDKGDNVLTDVMESTLPKEHIDILRKYDPEGYVPAFVIGCKYYRIGNGHESNKDLASEAAELKVAIESIIA